MAEEDAMWQCLTALMKMARADRFGDGAFTVLGGEGYVAAAIIPAHLRPPRRDAPATSLATRNHSAIGHA